MAKEQLIELTGEVVQELGNSMFKVFLETSGTEILCTISGRIRKNYIRIMSGDLVKVELSPYDLTKGRISRRLNSKPKEDDSNSVINNKSINSSKKKKKK
jgi:translation initiation factor IF-1